MISHKQAACICIDELPRTSASPIHIHARRSTFLFGDEKSKQTAHRALALVRVRQFFLITCMDVLILEQTDMSFTYVVV
jgi:hypothetical protein